jgi:hypothetical protein
VAETQHDGSEFDIDTEITNRMSLATMESDAESSVESELTTTE